MRKRSSINFISESSEDMNQKSTKDRAMILSLLVEGNSLRATTRLTGASINTVTEL